MLTFIITRDYTICHFHPQTHTLSYDDIWDFTIPTGRRGSMCCDIVIVVVYRCPTPYAREREKWSLFILFVICIRNYSHLLIIIICYCYLPYTTATSTTTNHTLLFFVHLRHTDNLIVQKIWPIYPFIMHIYTTTTSTTTDLYNVDTFSFHCFPFRWCGLALCKFMQLFSLPSPSSRLAPSQWMMTIAGAFNWPNV